MNALTLRKQRAGIPPAGNIAMIVFTCLALAAPFNPVSAQVAPSLGLAREFAVLGGSTVTSTGQTIVTGDLGVSPGTAITGFPPGTKLRAVLHAGDEAATQAQVDTAAAYSKLGKQACTTTYTVPTDLGGMTLPPGVYCFSSSAQLTGALTLDGVGNPNAVWVFKIGSTLTTASGSSVALANSAQQSNVFWQVGSSATLGTGTAFLGNILALASITLNTNSTLQGRALAQNGAVTLDANAVSFCVCIQPYTAIVPTVIKTIRVAPTVASVPGSVFGASLSPDGKGVWVAGYNSTSTPGFISLINVATLKVTHSVTVGAGPADIAFSSSGARAFVTDYYGSSLSVVTLSRLNVSQTIDLSGLPLTNPFGLAYAPSGQVMVTTQGAGNVVADFHTTTPLALDKAISVPGQSGRPAVAPSAGAYFAGDFVVPVFIPGSTPTTGHPELAIVSPASKQILASLTLTSSGAAPQAVVVSPDGKYAYVSLFDSTGGTGGVWVVSLENMTTRTIILTCDPANYGEAISADGKYLLVAGFSEDQVALIDTATDTVDAIIKGGRQPNAIALTGDDSEAFFTNQTDGTVTVVSFVPSL